MVMVMVMVMKILPSGIAVLENDLISTWVEQGRVLAHDQNALPQILPFIKPGMTVFDIGAHIGSHTIAYAKAVGANGTIFAIEPMTDAFECLVRNVKNYLFVRSFNMALGATRSKKRMSNVIDNAGSSHVGITGDLVLLETLDSLSPLTNSEPVFLKLDVEGYEPFVLIGGRNLIFGAQPTIVCEVNEGALNRYGFTGKALLAILDAYGYKWRNIYAEQACEGPQYDIIATPK